MSVIKEIDVDALIGGGYDEFFNFRGKYRVVKGGQDSKKSYTMTYWVILNMMLYDQANTLVIRKLMNTHRDSTFALFQKLIREMGVQEYWKVIQRPFRLIYKPTGQKIIFAGMDNLPKVPIKIKTGILCWVWFENADEITHKDFAIIDKSIHEEIPQDSGLWNQLTMTFNPWRPCWLKTEFFDRCDPTLPTYDPEFAKDCLCMTTTYHCNEWLDEKYHEMYESLKKTNPRRYEVVALGNWGTPDEYHHNEHAKARQKQPEPTEEPDYDEEGMPPHN